MYTHKKIFTCIQKKYAVQYYRLSYLHKFVYFKLTCNLVRRNYTSTKKNKTSIGAIDNYMQKGKRITTFNNETKNNGGQSWYVLYYKV